MGIINFKKKKMKLLTNQQQKSYKNAKKCYICKENFEDKHAKDENCHKVWNHCHYAGEYTGAAHSIGNLKYSVPKEFHMYIALKEIHNNPMVLLILFDTFVKCSSNVNLLSNVNPKCFCDDA